MKQCTKCGSWIEDNADYCNVCGMQQEKIYVSPVQNQGQATFSADENSKAPFDGPYGNEPPKSNSGLGIAGFILGIIGVLFTCCGGISLIISVVGLVLSIVAMVKFNPLLQQNRGLIIAGIVLNGIALLCSLVIIPFWGLVWEEIFKDFYHEFRYFYY